MGYDIPENHHQDLPMPDLTAPVNPGTISQSPPPEAAVVHNDLTLLKWAIQEAERLSGTPLFAAREAYNRVAFRAATNPGPRTPSPAGASREQLEREFTQQVAPVATLNDWVTFVNAWAREKGWNDKELHIGDSLMLMVTELAEAKEDDRKGRLTTYREEDGKPCGLPSEIADVLIRIFHFAGRMGMDLNNEVAIKMAYNYGRAKRHGGLRS